MSKSPKRDDCIIKIAESVARMEVDLKYVKEHVGTINDELGQVRDEISTFKNVCNDRLTRLETCNAIRKGRMQLLKEEWQIIVGISGGVATFITVLYYILSYHGVIRL
jgi:hypothetical protein